LEAAHVHRQGDPGQAEEVARGADPVDDLLGAPAEGNRVEQREVAGNWLDGTLQGALLDAGRALEVVAEVGPELVPGRLRGGSHVAVDTDPELEVGQIAAGVHPRVPILLGYGGQALVRVDGGDPLAGQSEPGVQLAGGRRPRPQGK